MKARWDMEEIKEAVMLDSYGAASPNGHSEPGFIVVWQVEHSSSDHIHLLLLCGAYLLLPGHVSSFSGHSSSLRKGSADENRY